MPTTPPALVLVHGLTCAHSDWALQVAALKQEFQCIAVDLRSHGKSTPMDGPRDMDSLAADVIEVCRHHGVRSAVFAGHSMGTRIVASIAEQAPEIVRALVLVDGSRQAADNPEQAALALQQQLIDQPMTSAFIKNMFDQMFTAGSDPVTRQEIVQRAIDTPASVFQDLLTQMLLWDSTRMESVFGSIRVPVHAIQSTTMNAERKRRSLQHNDTPPYLQFIESTIPQARTEVLVNTGHFPQLDTPDTVTHALRDMLRSVFE